VPPSEVGNVIPPLAIEKVPVPTDNECTLAPISVTFTPSGDYRRPSFVLRANSPAVISEVVGILPATLLRLILTVDAIICPYKRSQGEFSLAIKLCIN
jgi:hypothetical protein